MIEIVAVVVFKYRLQIHNDKIVVVYGSWLFIDMLEDILNGQSCFVHRSMSEDPLEIKVQCVDEIGVVHEEIFLSESGFFGHGFVSLHDRVQGSWHLLLVSVVDVFHDDLQFRRVRGGHVDQILVVKQFQWLVWAIDEGLLNNCVGLLIVNNEVEIERHNIVSDLERMVQMELLIPLIEDMLVLHSELVESYLGETSNVRFSNNSGSEVGLLDRCQKVLLEWVALRRISQWIDPLLAY